MRTAAKFLSVVCLAGACLASTPAVADSLYQVPVTESFNIAPIKWDQGFGGMDLAISLTTVQGQPMLCGAYSHFNGKAYKLNRQLLRKGWFTVDGKKVISDFSYFSNAGTKVDLIGKHATCKPLPVALTKTSKIGLGFDNAEFRP